MPHANGRIYIDTSTNPDQGVSFADVQQTLGAGSRDLGTLCQSPKINMLSRRKPTPYTGFDSGAEQAAYIDSGANYDFYAGGIYKPTTIVMDSIYPSNNVGTIQLVSQNLFPFTSKWTYQHPSFPAKYRLLDFNEYLHNGSISYPQTAAQYPYISAIDYGITNDSNVYTLKVAIMLRFNLTDAVLSTGGVAGLLGLKELLAEKDTNMSDLDFRLGFMIKVPDGNSGGYSEREQPISMLYISGDNLRNYGYQSTGVYNVEVTKDVTNNRTTTPSGIDSTHILFGTEYAQISPFIAKRYISGSGTTKNCWLLYGFGVTTPPVVQEIVSTSANLESGGTAAGSWIKLTLLIQQDGTYVFYIKEQGDFSLYFGLLPAGDEVFGTIPVSIGAGEGAISGKPAEITLGSQDSSSGYWHYTRQYNMRATASAINGWNPNDAPENRVGSLVVKPIGTNFTVNVCINTVKWPRQHSFTVNTSTAQTGDEFNWPIDNQ